MRSWHLGLNGFFLVLGLAVMGMSMRLTVSGPSGPGGGFLPLLIGAILAASSIALLVRPFRAVLSADMEWPDRAGLRRIAAVVASLVAFPVLMPVLGFLGTALAVMLCLLPAIAPRRWPSTLVLAMACSGGIYVVFVRLLGLNLPRGPWGF